MQTSATPRLSYSVFPTARRYELMRWWTRRNKMIPQKVCSIHNSGTDLFVHPTFFPPGLIAFNDPIQLTWFDPCSTVVNFGPFNLLHGGFLSPDLVSPTGHCGSIIVQNTYRTERYFIRPGYTLHVGMEASHTFSKNEVRMVPVPERLAHDLHVMI